MSRSSRPAIAGTSPNTIRAGKRLTTIRGERVVLAVLVLDVLELCFRLGVDARSEKAACGIAAITCSPSRWPVGSFQRCGERLGVRQLGRALHTSKKGGHAQRSQHHNAR